ncbi:MAG: DNA-processing protein DprA [Oscillospiraceae bacterium]
MSVIKYWMWLAGMTRLRPRAKSIALEYFGGIEDLFFAGEEELRRVAGLRASEIRCLSEKGMDAAMRALDVCQRENIQIVALGDSAYPRRLTHIYDPPAVLFVQGKLPAVDEEAAVAAVGTRRASPYGIKMATRLGYEITKGGGLIVSGLAEGIDTAAAVGALRAGGRCVGVLGTAIDTVYPKSNAHLFRDVCAEGAVISEYPPGTAGSRLNFPARNRIISGLSVGVLVVEAPEKSGALITAELASEQGRDVFAVPGNADADNCIGSNALLRDCAKLTMCGWDVLCEYQGLFPQRIHEISRAESAIPDEEAILIQSEHGIKNSAPRPDAAGNFPGLDDPVPQKGVDKEKDLEYIDLKDQLKDLNETQLKIISAMGEPDMYADAIIEKTGIPASEVMMELTMLQLRGFVTSVGFNQYRLNIKTKRG